MNDSTTDKVFKYTTAGALVSSWTITTAGATSPTGITIDPANVSNIWIVDSGTDRVYQYNAAATFANGSSHAADVAFALAVGNTNPQGIADPPAPGSLLATETPVLAEPVSAEAALRGNDAALASMYYEPLKKFRIDTVRRSESRAVESHTRDLSYTVGGLRPANRIANDSVANDKHHTEVDDLFAQWESDPLELLSLPRPRDVVRRVICRTRTATHHAAGSHTPGGFALLLALAAMCRSIKGYATRIPAAGTGADDPTSAGRRARGFAYLGFHARCVQPQSHHSSV